MSVQVKLEEWLRKMGYDGEIPNSLTKICNPSTSFIWEQIISNVKPRQEVTHVRRNIIVNRLKEKSLEQQHEFNYPNKEIQIYIKRQELESKIKILERNIEEKEVMVDDLLSKNKMTYVAIDNIKAKIKENEEKSHLLKRKSKMIEDDIQYSQEILTLVRNVTPVEVDENSDGKEITDTLQKCAEKLHKLAEGVSVPVNSSKINPNRSSMSSMKMKRTFKNPSRSNHFSKYLNHSKTLINTMVGNRSMNKENIYTQNMYSSVNQPVRLYSEKKVSESQKKSNKRESLGLLPDSCLDLSDEFDNVFLRTPPKTENLRVRELFPEPNSTQKNHNSMLKPFTKNSHSDEILEKLCSNKHIKEVLKDVLYKNNRQSILKNCQRIFEDLVFEIGNSTLNSTKASKANKGIEQDDLTDLFCIHVKNELEKEKCRVTAKKLRETIKKRKEEIYGILRSRNPTDNVEEILELQIEEAGLVAANDFLDKEIKSQKKVEINNELQVASAKLKQIKDENVYKVDCIQNLIENVYKMFEYIRNNREETSSCIKKLRPFIRDLSWANCLNEELNSSEVKLFEKFPLEYNRKLTYNDSKIAYRNICSSTLPSDITLDSNNLQMVTMLMDTPFSPAESIILSMLQSKLKLNTLRSLKSQSFDFDIPEYCVEELSQREEYLKSVMAKFDSIINSASVKQILSAPHDMKEVVDLWMEMPLRNFISDKRLVNGHNYKFYEQVFDRSKHF